MTSKLVWTLVALGVALSACAKSEVKAARDVVKMSVTDEGFEPSKVTVKRGEPVSLVITRKTDRTCATEFVIDEYHVNSKLPLNQAVTVTFTPTKSGEIQFGCGMNKMIGGVLTVE